MKLEKVVKKRIEGLDRRIEQLSKFPHQHQTVGDLSDMRDMLLNLLDEAKSPVMETQVDVELTLSVDSSIGLENIKGRILAFLGQSDGITPMSITLKDEAEIYGNE